MDLSIVPLCAGHWSRVRDIYLEGIATGHATFETTVPEWADWDEGKLPACRFVAVSGGDVVGWVALSPVSKRAVYAGVAEVSVYITSDARGQGVGKTLLAAVVAEAENEGVWTLQAGIFPENMASIALHERAGFRVLGTRERPGCLNGVWRDVLLMERRSKVVGV
jgi:phosphinothricin acetyltransferase